MTKIESKQIPWAKRQMVESLPLPKEPGLATVIRFYSENITAETYLIGEASLSPHMVTGLLEGLQGVIKKHPEIFNKLKEK